MQALHEPRLATIDIIPRSRYNDKYGWRGNVNISSSLRIMDCRQGTNEGKCGDGRRFGESKGPISGPIAFNAEIVRPSLPDPQFSLVIIPHRLLDGYSWG